MNCEFHEIFNEEKKASKQLVITGDYVKEPKIVNVCKTCYNRFAIIAFEHSGSKY